MRGMSGAPGGSAGSGHGSDPDEEALLRRIREFLRHGAVAEAGIEEWGEFAAQLRFLREELPLEERQGLLEEFGKLCDAWAFFGRLGRTPNVSRHSSPSQTNGRQHAARARFLGSTPQLSELDTGNNRCHVSPLARVHASVRRHAARGYTVVYIGGAGHAEVEGVIGEAPDHVILVQSVADAAVVKILDPNKVAYCTETTFAIDDVAAIVKVLRARFPAIIGPEAGDVCYAVQNRQEAVLGLVERHHAQLVLVMGSSNSANSRRLGEVALRAGARAAQLLESADQLDPAWLRGVQRVGVSAGASAPERLVQELVGRLRELGASSVQTVELRVEDVVFTLPPVPDHRERRDHLTGQKAC